MILGISLQTFTYLHVAISLIGIGAGILVVIGMINRRRLVAVTTLFLITTALTSLTGFLFPFKGMTPGIVIGSLSMIVVVLAALARRRVQTSWLSSSTSLFWSYSRLRRSRRCMPLHQLTEMPFKVAQLAALVVFAVLGTLAFRKFHLAE